MILYKYCAINDHLTTNLREHQLWFSSPSRFNDIDDSRLRLDPNYTDEDINNEFDFMTGLIFQSAMIRHDFSNAPAAQEAALRVRFASILADRGPDGRPDHSGRLHLNVERALEIRRQTIGICSFSLDDRSKLLWAHYADAHCGACLAIESDLDRECFPQLELVQYVDNLPKIKLLSHMQQNLIRLYTTKSSAWSYEREVRAFQQTCGHHALKTQSLQRVIFGVRVKPSDRTEICQLVRREFGQHVGLEQVLAAEGGQLQCEALPS